MLNLGIALLKCERERKSSESLPLIDVGVWCLPKLMCVCVSVYVRLRACEVVTRQVWPACCTCGCSSNYWTLFTSSGADDGCSHAGLSARKRKADRHHETPRGQATRGHTGVTSPPKKGCMTTVCAYVLQKQACEMSHDCDMSLVQCLLPIFRFTSEPAWTSANISERLKKKQLVAIKTLLFISVTLKADQHFLLLSPPKNVSTNGKEKLPWPHCFLWIWISVLILSDCGDVYGNNQAISYTYERRVFTTVGLTFHQIVSNKIQQCKHGGGSCTS